MTNTKVKYKIGKSELLGYWWRVYKEYQGNRGLVTSEIKSGWSLTKWAAMNSIKRAYKQHNNPKVLGVISGELSSKETK